MTDKLLPKYQCHREVFALKIHSITLSGEDMAILTFEETDYEDIEVSLNWIEKARAQPGWYYVVDTDGRTSASPPKVFEEDYSRVWDRVV